MGMAGWGSDWGWGRQRQNVKKTNRQTDRQEERQRETELYFKSCCFSTVLQVTAVEVKPI